MSVVLDCRKCSAEHGIWDGFIEGDSKCEECKRRNLSEMERLYPAMQEKETPLSRLIQKNHEYHIIVADHSDTGPETMELYDWLKQNRINKDSNALRMEYWQILLDHGLIQHHPEHATSALQKILRRMTKPHVSKLEAVINTAMTEAMSLEELLKEIRKSYDDPDPNSPTSSGAVCSAAMPLMPKPEMTINIHPGANISSVHQWVDGILTPEDRRRALKRGTGMLGGGLK